MKYFTGDPFTAAALTKTSNNNMNNNISFYISIYVNQGFVETFSQSSKRIKKLDPSLSFETQSYQINNFFWLKHLK